MPTPMSLLSLLKGNHLASRSASLSSKLEKISAESVSHTPDRDLLTIQPLVQYYSHNTNLMRLIALLSRANCFPFYDQENLN